MQDRFLTLGSPTTVPTTVGILDTTLESLQEMKPRSQNPDSVFQRLVTRLNDLRAILIKINGRLDSADVDPHYQLQRDLATAASCCSVLAEKLGSFGAKCRECKVASGDGSPAKDKFKLVFGQSTMKQVLRMMDRQVDALGLLLAACSRENLAQQQTLLWKSTARKTFEQVRENILSLYPFYEGEAQQRSSAVDKRLSEDDIKSRNVFHVLFLGPSSQTTQIFVGNWVASCGSGQISQETHPDMKRAVLAKVKEAIQELFDHSSAWGLKPRAQAQALLNEMEGDALDLSPETAHSIGLLWADPSFQASCAESFATDKYEFIFDAVQRVSREAYIPTVYDQQYFLGRGPFAYITEDRISVGQLSIHLCILRDGAVGRHKWIHQFSKVSSIVFITNLSVYNETLMEDTNINRMSESLTHFESIARSRWFANGRILLLLTHAAEFRSKLPQSPLSNYFPDFSGENEYDAASEYLIGRFRRLVRENTTFGTCVCEYSDPHALSVLASLLQR